MGAIYLNGIKYAGGSSGGGGGTDDYNGLVNKPSINNVELTQDKSLEDLGIESLTNSQMSNLLDTIK